MSLYVEVHCDVRKSGHAPGDVLRFLCWSHGNDNPQGGDRSSALSAARAQGWKIGPGNRAVCPGCLSPAPALRGE